MSKSLIGFIIFFVLVSAAVLVWTFSGDSADDNSNTVMVPLTTDEVANHNTADDCWTIIGGAVFNLTEYISSHPGGPDILRACGNDGTTLFLQRQTAEGEPVGSGTPHSPAAESSLNNFFLGDLEN